LRQGAKAGKLVPMRLRLSPSSGSVVLVAWLLAGCGSEFEPESGALGAGHCNGPGALSESFEDGEIDDSFRPRIYNTGLTIEESGGMLVFTPPDGGGSGSLEARYAIDLRSSFAVVEVPEVSGGFEGKSVSMTLEQGNSYSVSMYANEDSGNPGENLLHFDVRQDASNTKNSTPYDPQKDRWWRFGEKGGVLSFGTSPDGKSWTTHQEVPAPPFVEAGILSLAMNDNATVFPIEPIRFDNLNPQGGSFCGVDRLQESFDQDLGQGWSKYEDTDCIVNLSGAYDVTVLPGGVAQCSITTRHGYDLKGRELTVAFGSLPDPASGVSVNLTLSSGDDDRLTLQHSQGQLTATSSLGSASSNGSVDLAGGPSWWRIRDKDGLLEFEVSADGASFEQVHSVIVDTLPKRFLVTLRLQVYSGQPADTHLVVDSIN